jgi:hypothetical protein
MSDCLEKYWQGIRSSLFDPTKRNKFYYIDPQADIIKGHIVDGFMDTADFKDEALLSTMLTPGPNVIKLFKAVIYTTF